MQGMGNVFVERQGSQLDAAPPFRGDAFTRARSNQHMPALPGRGHFFIARSNHSRRLNPLNPKASHANELPPELPGF